MPSASETARARLVQTSEFTSAGFQATPTVWSAGCSRFASRKIASTGCAVPIPVIQAGLSVESRLFTPTPASIGAVTPQKTCFARPSRLAFAKACSIGVEMVATTS